MKTTVLRTPFGRLKARARRGSLVVTSFVVVVGMAVIVGGIHQMLKSQLEGAYEIQRISFAKLQARYLAEMGVNHMMYTANKTANVTTANPWSALGMGTGTGSQISIDFKDKVAMTRSVASATATCTVTRGAGNAFTVVASLSVPNVGTYTDTVGFTATYDAGGGGYPAAWELSSYTEN